MHYAYLSLVKGLIKFAKGAKGKKGFVKGALGRPGGSVMIDTGIHSHGMCMYDCTCNYEGKCRDCKKITENDQFLVGKGKNKAITHEDLQVHCAWHCCKHADSLPDDCAGGGR